MADRASASVASWPSARSRVAAITTWYVVLDPDGLIAYTDDASIEEAGQFVLYDGEPIIEIY